MYKAFVLIILLNIVCSENNLAQQATGSKPNILFYLIDDMGWMDAGYQGSDFYETPNIDQLSKEGVRFSQSYVSHPRCVPSRYSIMTGKYPARVRMPGPGGENLKPRNGKEVKAEEYTIADAFKSLGYSTFFTGKWHLASGGVFPENVGFDINIAGGHAGSPISYFYPYNVSKRGNKSKKAPIHGLEEGVEGEYLNDRITDETIKYLNSHFRNNKEQPFFAFISHYAVHEPIQAKEEHIKKFREKLKNMSYSGSEFIPDGTGTTKMRQDNPVYASMVYSMDESLGRIINTLKEQGEYDNTIIVFFSDNGGLSNIGFNPRKAATSNQPLRAGKGHLYEGGIRVPMIVKWPGVTEAGGVSEAVVTGTDFYPTLLDMVGASLRPSAHVDGESFVWALKNQVNPNDNRSFFWHNPVPRPHATGDEFSSAIRKGKYKLVDFYKKNRTELYNLEDDKEEQNNLSEEKPEILKEMLMELNNWRKDIDAFMGKEKSNKKSNKKSK